MYLWIIRGQRASAAASQSLAANKRRRTPSGSKGGNGDGRMAAGWRQGGGRVARPLYLLLFFSPRLSGPRFLIEKHAANA